MYFTLLFLHSIVRYALLALLIIVIFRSGHSLFKRKTFTERDGSLGLFLYGTTHTQIFLGFVLYFMSPLVEFSSQSMKNPITRYWSVEHLPLMLIATTCIIIARVRTKKAPSDMAKHRTLFVWNLLALLIILLSIYMSGRGFFSLAQ